MLKLYHESKLIGVVPDCSRKDHYGTIVLTEKAAEYERFFAYWCDEEKTQSVEDTFPLSLFENWSLEDEDGDRQEIYPPAVFKEEDIPEIRWMYV